MSQANCLKTDDTSLKARLHKARIAGSGCTALEAFRDVFSIAPRGLLIDLKEDPDDAIAIRAAWQLLCRTVPFDIRRADEQMLEYELAEADVSRFLGFVEGRLRGARSAWWESQLQESRINVLCEEVKSDEAIGYRAYAYYLKRDEQRSIPLEEYDGLWVRDNVIVTAGDDFIDIQVEDRSCRVSSADLKSAVAELKGGRVALEVTISDSHVGICAYELGSTGPIHAMCFNNESGAMLWHRRFDITCDIASGIVSRPQMSVVLRDDRLYVYGSLPWCLYIQGYRTDNGECAVAFNTAY